MAKSGPNNGYQGNGGWYGNGGGGNGNSIPQIGDATGGQETQRREQETTTTTQGGQSATAQGTGAAAHEAVSTPRHEGPGGEYNPMSALIYQVTETGSMMPSQNMLGDEPPVIGDIYYITAINPAWAPIFDNPAYITPDETYTSEFTAIPETMYWTVLDDTAAHSNYGDQNGDLVFPDSDSIYLLYIIEEATPNHSNYSDGNGYAKRVYVAADTDMELMKCETPKCNPIPSSRKGQVVWDPQDYKEDGTGTDYTYTEEEAIRRKHGAPADLDTNNSDYVIKFVASLYSSVATSQTRLGEQTYKKITRDFLEGDELFSIAGPEKIQTGALEAFFKDAKNEIGTDYNGN